MSPEDGVSFGRGPPKLLLGSAVAVGGDELCITGTCGTETGCTVLGRADLVVLRCGKRSTNAGCAVLGQDMSDTEPLTTEETMTVSGSPSLLSYALHLTPYTSDPGP
eukprot:1723737-Rhodomonas_salina.2